MVSTCRQSDLTKSDQMERNRRSDGKGIDKRNGKRKRAVSAASKDGNVSLKNEIRLFQHQRHSLCFGASRVAAMSGFNPYVYLPELLAELVYQGSLGRALRELDASALGLVLVSKEDQMEQIAKKAGPEVLSAWEDASSFKKRKKPPPKSVGLAEKIKSNAVAGARRAAALTEAERASISEGIRSAVDTSFGTVHEKEAIDLYEKMVGCKVRERNEETRVWDFAESNGNTVAPVGEARSWRPKDDVVGTTIDLSTPKKGGGTENSSDGDNKCNSIKEAHVENETERRATPFFSILGSIDGIRDDLDLSSTTKEGLLESDCVDNDGKDEWLLRPIVVECKHRMRKIIDPPPIYDQIQASVYCLMYGAYAADLIQILRTESSKKVKEDAGPRGKVPTPVVRRGTAPVETKISVTRINLNDPITEHRENFYSCILPRLWSFSDAAYAIGSNDEKRYRLLHALSEEDKESQILAWSILFSECKHLQHCDTAFGRETSGSTSRTRT